MGRQSEDISSHRCKNHCIFLIEKVNPIHKNQRYFCTVAKHYLTENGLMSIVGRVGCGSYQADHSCVLDENYEGQWGDRHKLFQRCRYRGQLG